MRMRERERGGGAFHVLLIHIIFVVAFILFFFLYITYSIYLRNLLTHTVNNLLQTLNNVKSIRFSVVKQIFYIIHIMCENFKTIP